MSSLKFIMDMDAADQGKPLHDIKRAPAPVAPPPLDAHAPDPPADEQKLSTPRQAISYITSITPTTTTTTINTKPPTATATTTSIAAVIHRPPTLPSRPKSDTPTTIPSILDHATSLNALVTAPPTSDVPLRLSSTSDNFQTAAFSISREYPGGASSSRPVAPRRHSSTSTKPMEPQDYSHRLPIRMGMDPGRSAITDSISNNMASSSSSSFQSGLMRPMVQQPPPGPSVRLTPITGRISRAKKGQPVHKCDICKSDKSYTRAEHLRRHKLTHENPQFRCPYPGCPRSFFRADLFARHQQKKHGQEIDPDSMPFGADQGRRVDSPSSGAGGPPDLTSYSASSSGTMPPHQSTSSSYSSVGASGTTSGSFSGPGVSATAPSTDMSARSTFGQAIFYSSPDAIVDTLASPEMTRRSFSYETSDSGTSQEFSNTPGYILSPSAEANPIIRYRVAPNTYEPPRVTAAVHNWAPSVYRPRSTHATLCVVTQGLPDLSSSLHVPEPSLPDLSISPLGKSSTDGSTFSTPVSDIHKGWIPRTSPPNVFTAVTSQETSSIDTWADHYVLSHGPQSPRSLVSPPSNFGVYPGINHHQIWLDEPSSSVPFTTVDHSRAMYPEMEDNRERSVGSGASMNAHCDSTPTPFPTRNQSLPGGSLVIPTTVLRADEVGASEIARRQKEMSTPSSSGTVMNFGNGDGISSSGAGYGQGDDANYGQGPFGGSHSRGSCLSSPVSLVSPLPRGIQKFAPEYRAAFWNSFGSELPFVQRRMAEETQESVLNEATTAMGAQFREGREHQQRGRVLHWNAWSELKRIPQWNLQVLQAILLCEFLARFRGAQPNRVPSKPFENLYSRAIDQVQSLLDPALTADSAPHLTSRQRWRGWLVKESYRRLASSCFILDVHASLYYQVPRARDFNLSEPGSAPPLTFMSPSQDLWDASSAEEWDATLNANPAAGSPVAMFPSAAIIPNQHGDMDEAADKSPRIFDKLLILAAETLRLPKRELGGTSIDSNTAGQQLNLPQYDMVAREFDVEERIANSFSRSAIANTYLALHHTPLQHLLAVTRPVTGSLYGNGSQNRARIRQWTEPFSSTHDDDLAATSYLDMSAKRAVVYAARSLVKLVVAPPACKSSIGAMTNHWAIFVCTLICWACAMRAAEDHEDHGEESISEHDAHAWLCSMADLQADDSSAIIALVQDRRCIGVIESALGRLQQDYATGSNSAADNVVAALKRLQEGSQRSF